MPAVDDPPGAAVAMAGAPADIIAERLAVIFCGINPEKTAARRDIISREEETVSGAQSIARASTPEEILPENDRTMIVSHDVV
jgi:hypothetical protein